MLLGRNPGPLVIIQSDGTRERHAHLEVAETWFECTSAGTRLRLAAEIRGAEAAPREFWCRLIDADGALMRFSLVAEIKGRTVFEATALRSACCSGPSRSAELWLLSGPLREATRDAS